MIGSTLGHYRVLQLLGRGGMGEVYLAEDTKLQRQVALKVLASDVIGDRSRRERLEREARAVAALNHPHIVTLYAVEEIEGVAFLTLEFVDGQTLAALIPPGGLPLDRLLALGIPIADAVGTAHQRGITHRDLKPSNVMVTSDGRVKVLDFGLARLRRHDWSGEETAISTIADSSDGRLIGTIAYMSPEQAEGKPADARSDVFALGVVLYEMATGQRPFGGPSSMAVLSAILKDTPSPISDVRRDLPADLERIVRRCLEKDPDDRYQTAKDLRNDLRALAQTAPVPTGSHWLHPRRRIIQRVTAVAIVAAAIAGATWWRVTRGVGQTESQTVSRPFETLEVTSLSTSAVNAALSGDGQLLAYAGHAGVWVQHLPTRALSQVLSGPGFVYRGWIFSRDARTLYYVASRTGERRSALYSLPSFGGTPQLIIDNVDSLPSFSPDDTRLVFVRRDQTKGENAIVVATSQGTDARPLITFSAPTPLFSGTPPLAGSAVWSPDGRQIATVALELDTATAKTAPRILIVDSSSGSRSLVPSRPFSSISDLQWMPDGRTLLLLGTARETSGGRESRLHQVWSVDYSSGDTRPLTAGTGSYRGLSLARDGRSFVTTRTDQRDVIWIASTGTASQAQPIRVNAHESDGRDGLAWTPDGRLVYTAEIGDNVDLWVMNTDGTERTRLTRAPAAEFYPAVSPDGRYVLFQSAARARSNAGDIMRIDVDGRNQKPLARGESFAVSADSQSVYYHASGVLRRVPIDGGESVLVYDATQAGSGWPQDVDVRPRMESAFHRLLPAPDGRWIAGPLPLDKSLYSGLALVPLKGGGMTHRFPSIGLMGMMLPASSGWSADGRHFVYSVIQLRPTPTVTVWAQPVDGNPRRTLVTLDALQLRSLAVNHDVSRVAAVAETRTSETLLITSSPR